MDKPKKLVLDYSKWRCGFSSSEVECNYQIGKGAVRLLNEEGFSCCLGQFSAQLGIEENKLLDRSSPQEIGEYINCFTKGAPFFTDSDLSIDCIEINDDPKTTPDEKIKILSGLLAKEGIELEVINKP